MSVNIFNIIVITCTKITSGLLKEEVSRAGKSERCQRKEELTNPTKTAMGSQLDRVNLHGGTWQRC